MKHAPHEYLTTLARLCDVPRRIISYHDNDHLAALVLCDVCQPWCCNIQRAAYLVDNPDFSCCRGVAGYAADEVSADDVWQSPETVAQQYDHSSFHNTVRHFALQYLEQGFTPDVIQRIAQDLGIKQPQVYEWTGRYGNRGVLVYESTQPLPPEVLQHMPSIVSLLSLCPAL